MTENPAFVTAKKTVTTFSSSPEEDKEKDHMYEVLPFDANKEGPRKTPHVVPKWRL